MILTALNLGVALRSRSHAVSSIWRTLQLRSDVLGPNDAVSLALPTWAAGGQGVNAMERCRRRREGVKVDFQGWQRVMSVARRSEWAVGG